MLATKLKCLFSALLILFPAFGLISHAAAEDDEHVHHEHGGELMLFPSMQGIHNDKTVSGQVQNKLHPEVNIFYSIDYDRLRFLAEYLVRDDEQEMERLQLGWLAHPSATLWLGRFHSPLGFWNSEHHHGAYLQTTISRPSILAFEDQNGVLPTHIFGALTEGSVEASAGEYNYAFGIGQGPVMKESLEPEDILDPRGKGKLTLGSRLSYRPRNSDSEFGAYAGSTRIPLRSANGLDEARQLAIGAFFNMESERLRFLAELFRVKNRLIGPDFSHRTTFSVAYLQPEYRLSQTWKIFGRLEATSNRDNDAYLSLFPEFITSRVTVGSRFDPARNQALKFELSRNGRQDGVHFNQVSMQWSMVYP